MSEQILRISSLQSRLDEQRHRAEELHRQGASDLNIKVYDLQAQLTNVQEKLGAREKQITSLKEHLEQSKVIIDRLETELARGADSDKSKLHLLEANLQANTEENTKLKEKIRTEMINKLALPDLMETMLSEKNEELDFVKEQLDAKTKQLQVYVDLHLSDETIRDLQRKNPDNTDKKLSTRTSSDVVSLTDNDDVDIVRRAATEVENLILTGPLQVKNMVNIFLFYFIIIFIVQIGKASVAKMKSVFYYVFVTSLFAVSRRFLQLILNLLPDELET